MENTHKNAPYPQKKDSFSGNASSKKQNDNKNEADFAPFYPIPQPFWTAVLKQIFRFAFRGLYNGLNPAIV